MKLLVVNNLKKIYSTWFKTYQVETSKDVDSFLEQKEYVAIMGECDSGKTTSLNIFASSNKTISDDALQNGRNILSIRRR